MNEDIDISELRKKLEEIFEQKLELSNHRLKSTVTRLLRDFRCDTVIPLFLYIQADTEKWRRYFQNNGKQILVVDDSRAFTALMKKLLEDEGYSVFTVDSAKACLRLIKDEKFDLITMDVELPDRNGYSLAKRISACFSAFNENERHNGQVPIVMVTIRDTVEDRKHGIDSGACDFVVKRNVKKELAISINRILEADHRFEGMHAIVVEQNIIKRKTITASLLAKGLSVEEFDDGDMALEYIQSNPKKLDLAILFSKLEGVSSLDLCNEIKHNQKLRSVPVIMVGGEENREQIIDFYRCGGNDYLPEAFLKEELEARLYQNLDTRFCHKKIQNELRTNHPL
ncbi:MAG: response regulator [Bacteriovoracaceae bacterium]|nr:response regulator [Bacteriovoracaceae bacterium]